MRKAIVAALAVISTGLIAATCDPNNQPPNAPKARVLEFDATSLTIVFGNNCIDPDSQPGACEQWVIVTGDGQDFAKRASGGIVVVPNRRPNTAYDIFPYHIDGEARTNGTTIANFKTAGTTGPKILGVSPTEIITPASEVVISGLGFKSGVTAKLIEPSTNSSQTLSIKSVTPRRVTVAVPEPVGLTKRKPYFIVLTSTDPAGFNNKVHPKADIVYLNPDQTTVPPGQELSLSFVRWQPSGYCDGLLCRECFLIDGWDPLVKDYIASWLWPGGVGKPTSDFDDWWPDTWTDPFWSRIRPYFDDAGRDWSAMCSEAWGAAERHIEGATEWSGRLTLPSGRLAWLNLAYTSRELGLLYGRQRLDSNGDLRDFCTEDKPPTALPRRVPDDCVNWKVGSTGTQDWINVHLVLAMDDGGIEVDPNDTRGITNPPNIYRGIHDGLIVLTDNPFKGARRRFVPTPSDGLGCSDEDLANHESGITHWYFEGADPVNRNYWPEWYGKEYPPGLLAHETHHALTGYVHSLRTDFPDPCYTPAVAGPDDTCPRGFNMTLDPNESSLSAYSQCARAVSSDYTH